MNDNRCPDRERRTEEAMTTSTASIPSTAPTTGPSHRGPSLAAVGAVVTVLFVASLVLGTVIAGGEHFPSPFEPAPLSSDYFARHAGAVRLAAFLQFGASIPLGIFTATVVSRLRFLGVNVAGTAIALFGGVAASFSLATSALLQWVLSQPGVVESAGVVRAFHLLAFATGGPGTVVPAGLLLAGVSVSAGLHRLVPRWLMWFGLVVAAVAEVSALSLVVPSLAYLLPIARFPSFVWMICTGVLLAKSRRPQGGSHG
jgi:hypothetical protein